MTNEIKGKAIVDFEKIIDGVWEDGVDTAKKQAEKRYLAKVEDVEQKSYLRGMDDAFDSPQMEKHNTEYCVEQFSDCKTLQDFQDKLKEITLRSFNFM